MRNTKLTLLFLVGGMLPLKAQHSLEFTPMVSFFTGDVQRTNTFGGGQAVWRLNHLWWFGVGGMVGKSKLDSPNGLGVKSGDLFYQVEGNVYLNVPSLMSTHKGAENGVGADLYTSVGVGMLHLGSHNEVVGTLGGGMIVHFPLKWIHLKFDLKNSFYRMKNTQGSDFVSDLTLSIGPSFIF